MAAPSPRAEAPKAGRARKPWQTTFVGMEAVPEEAIPIPIGRPEIPTRTRHRHATEQSRLYASAPAQRLVPTADAASIRTGGAPTCRRLAGSTTGDAWRAIRVGGPPDLTQPGGNRAVPSSPYFYVSSRGRSNPRFLDAAAGFGG